jgi:opacity protein-like surface antigen
MRKLAIAMALASTMLVTPAVARDGSAYVGIEGGAMIVEDTNFDFTDDDGSVNDGVVVDHRVGYDIDLIAGYDLGSFRVEGELGYKRASVGEVGVGNLLGTTGPGVYYDASGRVRALSAMVNLLVDFGDDGGLNGYVGPGVGFASVKTRINADDEGDFDTSFSDSDSAIAWQIVAGVRAPITPNLDLGLKYRFFNTQGLDYRSDDFDLDGRMRTHSLLASLIYNFAAPAPPPPPPPPPPAPVRGN